MNIKVLSPQNTIESIDADGAILSCVSEQITVLDGHQPFMNCLTESQIKCFKSASSGNRIVKTINVKNALVKMFDDELVILSSEIKD